MKYYNHTPTYAPTGLVYDCEYYNHRSPPTHGTQRSAVALGPWCIPVTAASGCHITITDHTPMAPRPGSRYTMKYYNGTDHTPHLWVPEVGGSTVVQVHHEILQSQITHQPMAPRGWV